MRAHKFGCMSDTCQIRETLRTPRKLFNKNITNKQGLRAAPDGNPRRGRNLAQLQALKISLPKLRRRNQSRRSPSENRFPASTKGRLRFFPSSKKWNFTPRLTLRLWRN